MTPEYKAEKQASVTDLQGGGIWEINILTSLAPVWLGCVASPERGQSG